MFKTIKYGIPAKGMIAWKNQLTPSQIVEVSSYILTLQGTNPANAKAPQGEVYNADGADEEAPAEEAAPIDSVSSEEAVEEAAVEVEEDVAPEEKVAETAPSSDSAEH